MRKRLVIIGSLIFALVLLTPHIAQPVSQDDSLKDAVATSIEAGVEYLKKAHLANGVWEHQGLNTPNSYQVIGCTALCGIALMECKVPTNDRHITAVASVIRAAVSNQQFNYNYGVCLSLLFLDRLHRTAGIKHVDSITIIRLANMIASGQCQDGGWGYTLAGGGPSDNSNTQFAVVALWVARKYNPGAAIDRALDRADKKFRNSQRNDGGWGYDARNIQLAMSATGSMTCAGLLGIALNARAQKQPMEAGFQGPGATVSTGNVYKTLETDPQVIKGRAYLLSHFDDYINGRGRNGHITYFFWSLERVATFYRWSKLDAARTIDWYDKGARYLMGIQNKRTGAWEVDSLHGPAVDTSFALLFLAKSNLLDPVESVFTGQGSLTDGVVLKPKETKPEAPKNHEQITRDLVSRLRNALANERVSILNELRDGPHGKEGNLYTNALVDAIDKLDTPASKTLAREALAERMQGMTTKTVIAYLSDNNRELRLAAVRAVGHKKELDTAGELIPLLEDKDADVSSATQKSLIDVTGQNFGKSVSQWSRWLDTTRAKKPD